MDRIETLPAQKSCGAKTRAGTPCQRPPMLNGRCSKHGGKSLAGLASPRFKHGLYSRNPLLRLGAVAHLIREAGGTVETLEDWAAVARCL